MTNEDEKVGLMTVGEDGHRHDWRLWEREWVVGPNSDWFGVASAGWQETWYCTACRTVIVERPDF